MQGQSFRGQGSLGVCQGSVYSSGTGSKLSKKGEEA